MCEKYNLNDCEIDNRDDVTTELHLPNGTTLEVTKKDLEILLLNMKENSE